MSDQLKLLIDIVTPVVLLASFLINLMIKNDQSGNKAELLRHQNEIKDELKAEQAKLDIKVETHIAKDEEFQRGLSRTLDRIDRKLDK